MKLLLLPVLGLVFCTHAQQYRTAFGIKSDLTTYDLPSAELSLKTFITEASALEFNLGGNRRFFWLQAMYHRNQSMTRYIDWYWGAGVDGGYWYKPSYGRTDVGSTEGFWTGLNGTIGLEYTFQVVPINLALDTGPSLRLVPNVKFGWMLGFSMRYAFR